MTSSRRLAGIAAVAAALAACQIEHPVTPGLLSFEVTFAEGSEAPPTGSPEAPLAFVAGSPCVASNDCPDGEVCSPDGACALELRFDVRAIGRDGETFNYRGPVHVRVTPGETGDESDHFQMEGGLAEDVVVHLLRGIGPTHVWFEVDGVLPKAPAQAYGQCSDGIDNDANGYVDLADPGCESAGDDLEAPVNGSTGLSPTFWFHDPTLRDVQSSASLLRSPLEGRQVQISSGTLVVTNVTAGGFYVVDVAANDEDGFAGLFVFTFAKPEGVDYGDVLCGFSGAVDEHVGHTQLVFPSYEVYEPGKPACEGFDGLDPSAAIPEPWALTDLLVEEDRKDDSGYLAAVYANSLLLERFESNLVTFSEVEVATRFIACDRNSNGIIEDGEERDCRDDCQTDGSCSDLESWFQFSQYAAVTGGKKVVYGSVALAEDFVPLDIEWPGGPDLSGRCQLDPTTKGFVQYLCPPLTLASLTGSLRHIYLCGETWEESQCDLQFWVVDPRFDGDVVVAPAPGETP